MWAGVTINTCAVGMKRWRMLRSKTRSLQRLRPMRRTALITATILMEIGMVRKAYACIATALFLALAGCSVTTNRPASVAGECKIFSAPAIWPEGKERSDQRWIDRNVEAGVASCEWKRPKQKIKPVK